MPKKRYNPETIMYEDENALVTYRPKEDDYLLKINSSLSGERFISLDQRLIEEFSRHDADYLSDKLLLMNLSHGMSRRDIISIHHAIGRTADEYNAELEKFKQRENL